MKSLFYCDSNTNLKRLLSILKDSLNKKFPKNNKSDFFTTDTKKRIREYVVKMKDGQKQKLPESRVLTSIQMTKIQRYVEKSNFETANGSKITRWYLCMCMGKQVKKLQTCFYLDWWIGERPQLQGRTVKMVTFLFIKHFLNIRTLWMQNPSTYLG